LVLFIAFFVPGFISIKVYDLFLPVERRDASRVVLDAVTFSCVNYALLSWLIFLDIHYKLAEKAPDWHAAILVVLLFVSPALLAVGYLLLRRTKLVTKYIPHPTVKPWDYVFGKRKSYWTILHLNDGTSIGGMYDTESFASSYPAQEQIYIQQVWEIEGRRFVRPVDRSSGTIVSGKDIKSIEFFT